MPLKNLRLPTLEKEGVGVEEYKSLHSVQFNKIADAMYTKLKPARNANNKLNRGIRWGIYANDKIHWLERSTYSLPKDFNKEESGNTRQMDLIPIEFMEMLEVDQLIKSIFKTWSFPQDSSERAYEVQISAIRYRATLSEPAMPSPVVPHQDLVDGAIVLLNKSDNVLGGTTRVFDLDSNPLYEVDLEIGEALFVKDKEYLHQVSPILLDSKNYRPHMDATRDIMIVRFQPVGR